MKKNLKLLKLAIASVAVVAVLYVVAIYAFVFVPSFTRLVPDDEGNKKYFVTEDNFNEYLNSKTWFFSKDPQKINITSFDGLNLSAWILPSDAESVGTIILMHGYHSEPIREFVILARFYHELGYNVVLPYQRTHGDSEGKYITFGVKERFDLRDWMHKTNDIFGTDKPLFVEGISMGCATTVMSLGCDDLPSNLKGIIADCGFTSPKEIIWKVLAYDKKAPTARLIMAIGEIFVENIAGFKMDEYSTIDAIDFNKTRENQIPILFIHGTADDFVPIEMSDKNFARCIGEFSEFKDGDIGNIAFNENSQIEKYKYIQIENSPHAIANLIDKNKYCSEVLQFLEKWKK